LAVLVAMTTVAAAVLAVLAEASVVPPWTMQCHLEITPHASPALSAFEGTKVSTMSAAATAAA